jgi:hypothetical protein
LNYGKCAFGIAVVALLIVLSGRFGGDSGTAVQQPVYKQTQQQLAPSNTRQDNLNRIQQEQDKRDMENYIQCMSENAAIKATSDAIFPPTKVCYAP